MQAALKITVDDNMDEYILTDGDKEYIRTYVADAPTDEEKRERRKECALVFGLSLPQVAAITAHTLIRARREIKQNPLAVIPIAMPAGSAMDYDNPIKQKYRTTFKNYIDRNTNPNDRPNMKVLCFPGRKCLEVPLYLDLGFKSQNIVGVESEASVLKEFLANAAKYGISVRTTDALNVADEMEWDVVNFDFTGPLTKDTVPLLAYLRMSTKYNRKSILGLNFLVGRESESAQKMIDNFYAVRKFGEDFVKDDFIGTLIKLNEIKANMEERMGTISEMELKEKREFAVHSLVLSRLGYNYAPNNRIVPAPEVPEKYRNHDSVSQILAAFFKMLWRTFENFGLPKDYATETSHKLLEIYKMGMAPGHVSTGLQQVQYISPSKQRFMAYFYSLEYAQPHGAACDDVIRFINESVTALASIADKLEDDPPTANWSFQVRDRKGFVHKHVKEMKLSDTLEMTVEGKVSSRLSCRTMEAALNKVADIITRDVIIKAMHGKYIPETMIL